MVTRSADPNPHPIAHDERHGVLHPGRLARYSAGWITPDLDVSTIVDQYWHVTWSIGTERLDQRVIDLPAVTVTIEDGDVPAPLVITGVHSRAWRRTITGTGRVFAIRLRPAGLAVLSDLVPSSVADVTVPLTATLDARLHDLMHSVAAHTTPANRAQAANGMIRQLMTERPPTKAGLLANNVLDELRETCDHRAGPVFASRFARSERTIQRAFADTLGHGPKWISRRLRLQEVALALVTRPEDTLAMIAADLGYTDQSHLTSDFRNVSGITPDTYRRAAQRFQAQ